MTTQQEITQTWGLTLQTVVCDQCDWNFLVQEQSSPLCPHCFKGTLRPFEMDADNLQVLAPPELAIDFQVDSARLTRALTHFIKSIPYPPEDLTAQNLTQRAQRVYLPMWLVDASIHARWQAQAGYNYEVESHRTQYQGGQWATQKVKETRIDWEARVGELQRDYANVTAPALEEHHKLMQALGGYDKAKPAAYDSAFIRDALVRLPNRVPTDAFPDAKENFRERASEDVRQAAKAEQVREFQWQAHFDKPNWTQLLLPVIMTYYTDDNQQKRIVQINGFDGHYSGERRSSMKHAQRYTFIGLGIALVILVIAIGLLLLQRDLTNLATIAAILATVIGFASLFPVITVWRFNQQEDR